MVRGREGGRAGSPVLSVSLTLGWSTAPGQYQALFRLEHGPHSITVPGELDCLFLPELRTQASYPFSHIHSYKTAPEGASASLPSPLRLNHTVISSTQSSHLECF